MIHTGNAASDSVFFDSNYMPCMETPAAGPNGPQADRGGAAGLNAMLTVGSRP
jgi:hypothetical protein